MTYQIQWAAAWAVAVVGVVAGVLASGVYHPTWLTDDVRATAALVSAVCVGLAAILPQLGRTPAKREQNYLLATQGLLPKDLNEKHAEALMQRREESRIEHSG